MSTNPVAYNVSRALLGLQEADTRHKGEQRGTVRRKGKRWYIAFRQWIADEAGNLEYRKVERKIEGEFRSESKAAQAGYDQWVSKANAENKIPQGLATVEQFYTLRFKPDHVEGLKKSGRIHYRTMWDNHIKPTLGAIQMRDVTPQMVQQLITAKTNGTSARTGEPFASETIHHIHKCLSAIFRHAKALRFYAGELPTEGVKLPSITHKERQSTTWEQDLMLAEAVGPKHRNLVIVLAQTGMRIGEACGLKWKYCNLTDDWRLVDGEAIPPRCLWVISNWTKGERTTTKGNRGRKVPLTRIAWDALRQHNSIARFNGPDQPVFASRVGTPLDAHNISNRILKPAAKKIGIPWASFHCLRHGTATMADAAGMTIAEKQKILGHRTADISTHYTHPEIERVRDVMEQMGKGKPN